MKADLQALCPIPSDSPWSEWRSSSVTRVACFDAVVFVRRWLPPAPAHVLEVGCGNGYLCLELARAGYAVLGIDPSLDAIGLAESTAAGQPPPVPTYLLVPIEQLDRAPQTFDAVVCNRSLHHLPGLEATVQRLASLLRPGGRIVCREFCRDTLDMRTAQWLLTAASDPQEAAAFLQEWHQVFEEHHLHGRDAMLAALRREFVEVLVEPLPYLYVHAANRATELDPSVVRETERTLIELGAITAAGLAFVGSKP